MDWLLTSLYWYLILFLLGLLFFPLTRRLFGAFADQGWAFSKTIAILVVSYTAFVLGTAKIMPFTQINLLGLVGLFGLLGFFVAKIPFFLRLWTSRLRSGSNGDKKNLVSSTFLKIIIFEEIIVSCDF